MWFKIGPNNGCCSIILEVPDPKGHLLKCVSCIPNVAPNKKPCGSNQWSYGRKPEDRGPGLDDIIMDL